MENKKADACECDEDFMLADTFANIKEARKFAAEVKKTSGVVAVKIRKAVSVDGDKDSETVEVWISPASENLAEKLGLDEE